MANVSFYLIAILALHVKCHSLQERSVPGNVLIVDHHVKKNIMFIYSLYSCGHTTEFYWGKTDLPRANSSKISQGKFILGFVLPR